MKKILYIPKNYAERYYILTCPECGCRYVVSSTEIESRDEYDEFECCGYVAKYSVCPNCGKEHRLFKSDLVSRTEEEMVEGGYMSEEDL